MYKGHWEFRGATNTWTERSLDQAKPHGEMEEKAKEAVESVVISNFVSKLREQGFDDIVVTEYTTDCKVVNVASRQFRDWTIDTYEIQVSIDLWFTTEHEIMGSPISPIILGILVLIIKYIIIAITIGLTVYFVVTSLWTRKSTVTVEYYDSEGNLVKKETKEETAGPLSDPFGGVMIAIIVMFALLLIMGGSFTASKKKGVRIGK
jgi:hypothetical protein